MYTTLIRVTELQALQSANTPLMVFDCSFDLMKPEVGPAVFQEQHITGAVYAHLDTALSDKSGSPDAASGGRHPLPSREKFAAWLSSMGFRNNMQAVVYDRNGCNYCGRLWWMLKWAGHDDVAVLNGGLQAWVQAGGAMSGGFSLKPALRTTVSTQDVLVGLGQASIIDARAVPRYRGEVEPLDPIAGHIPGALNRPFTQNFDSTGHFKPAATLNEEFSTLLAKVGQDPTKVIHHCGSGVSAIPNVLAMEIAGFAPTTLYAGSWSEWSNTPGVPVEKG